MPIFPVRVGISLSGQAEACSYVVFLSLWCGAFARQAILFYEKAAEIPSAAPGSLRGLTVRCANTALTLRALPVLTVYVRIMV